MPYTSTASLLPSFSHVNLSVSDLTRRPVGNARPRASHVLRYIRARVRVYETRRSTIVYVNTSSLHYRTFITLLIHNVFVRLWDSKVSVRQKTKNQFLRVIIRPDFPKSITGTLSNHAWAQVKYASRVLKKTLWQYPCWLTTMAVGIAPGNFYWRPSHNQKIMYLNRIKFIWIK